MTQYNTEYIIESQNKLVWNRFKKHKVAYISLIILIFLYLIALFADFIAPYNPNRQFNKNLFSPPHIIHLFHNDIIVHPFIFGYNNKINKNFQRVYVKDNSDIIKLKFFAEGDKYELFGFIETNYHLFGTDDLNKPVFILGSDRLGRDLFSRVIYGTRISLTIGLVGVFLSFVLGLIIGGVSGYYGGIVDEIIQRFIDILVSIPSLPLWMALAAAVPTDWTTIETYFAITIVLSIVGWAGLARTVRGFMLSLREQDFAVAARVSGVGEFKIIVSHLLPLFFSYIIVSITLSIPNMIIGETALSFLGLGLQPPAVSWGVLLKDSQQIISVALHPWLLSPAVFVTITVLLFNFLGDGLRDAADPYSIL